MPYKGNYMADLLSEVPMAISPIPPVIEYVKNRRLRAIGVTTAERSAALPDVLPIGAFVPGYAAIGWYGLSTPKDTPVNRRF
jgi:tripartite-type tricarboxylate transporter receptor subunit TctC